MLKKFVLGLVFAVSGLLVWSCGDGSVDALDDTELLVISRFPSTIDYDLLDSVVNACKKDNECWEKAKKSGEIYKGDYTKVLRDDSGNIIIQEGDSAFVWKDGKKLPVFDFSSNSEEDDDEGGSNGGEVTSGSSRVRSSGAGYDEDEYIDEYGPTSGGSGSGTGEVNHNRSSNSNSGSGNSSSIDLSFLSSSSKVKVLSSSTVVRSSSSSKKNTTSSSSRNFNFLSSSSSSLGVASSSSIDNGDESSSSKIVIDQSSVSQSSSSVTPYQVSSSSNGTHQGGNGNGGSCKDTPLVGRCVGNPSDAIKGNPVTYTFTPAANNECEGYKTVEWNVTKPDDGADVTHAEESYASAQESYSFVVSYSTLGDKKSVMFTMGGENVMCEKVTVKRACESNTYTCTGERTGATNNLWKNAVQYTWNFAYSGCLEVTNPVTWNGTGLTVNGYTATKSYAKGTSNPVPASETVTVTVVDELGSNTVTCTPAISVVYVEDLPPTCNVNSIDAGTGLDVAVTPSSVTGCAYDNNKCSYSLTLKDDNNVITSGSSGYNGGTLTLPSSYGSLTDGETLTYTLTLKNYLGGAGGSCDFNVTYYDEIPVTASMTKQKFIAGRTYNVSTGTLGNGVPSDFVCYTSNASSSPGVEVGTMGGSTIRACSAKWCGTPKQLSSNSSYVFEVSADAPSDLQCALAYN